EPTTCGQDAIVELRISRSQTESRRIHRNDHHVGVVNNGLEARRGDVVQETIQSESARERCGTTRRHENVKQISSRISKRCVDDLEIVRSVSIAINEDIERDVGRSGPSTMRCDAEV